MPHRRCVGCGRIRPQAELHRFARADEGIVADPERRRPGRGAYLCPTAECAEEGLRRRGLQRTLRAQISVAPQTLDLLETWPRSAYTR